MKTLKKTETYFKMIEGIKYNNEHGGAYAYVQFLAYTRDLIRMLRPFKKVEKQLDSLEGISWLFNECLTASFTHSQKAIFDNKLSETRIIFDNIRASLKELETESPLSSRYLHRQAA